MRRFAASLMIAATLAASSSRAEIDPAATPPFNPSGFELIVLEANGCLYCSLFRRDVLPTFTASEQGRALPVRFLDINDLEGAGLELQSGVDVVPTFVVARDHKEIGRIPGYVGPENFYHAIEYLLSTAP